MIFGFIDNKIDAYTITIDGKEKDIVMGRAYAIDTARGYWLLMQKPVAVYDKSGKIVHRSGK